MKEYNFEKFTNGITEDTKLKINRKQNFSSSNTSDEVDPIQTDNRDSKFLYENDDAIIFDLKRGNSN